MMVLFYGQKILILMYLESFSMKYSPHWDLQLKKNQIFMKKKFNTFVQVLNFLDVFIILHQNGWLETDIFYWDTNSNDFINCFIHHLEHTKQNIYNLAKRIIVFVSDEKKINERLSELKTWLLSCSYLLAIIEKASFNAKLQGPAPKKRRDSYSVCINT